MLQGKTGLAHGTANGTFYVDTDGAFKVTGGTLNSVVNGPGTLDVAGGNFNTDITTGGPRLFRSGTLTGTRQVPAGATLTIPENWQSHIGAGSVLTDNGTIEVQGLSGGGPTYLLFDCNQTTGGTASLINNGLIELSPHANLSAYGCGNLHPLLTNTASGTVEIVDGGVGVSMGVGVENEGSIIVGEEATSEFGSSPFINDGSIVLERDAQFFGCNDVCDFLNTGEGEIVLQDGGDDLLIEGAFDNQGLIRFLGSEARGIHDLGNGDLGNGIFELSEPSWAVDLPSVSMPPVFVVPFPVTSGSMAFPASQVRGAREASGIAGGGCLTPRVRLRCPGHGGRRHDRLGRNRGRTWCQSRYLRILGARK